MKQRLVALDALRGLTVALMILVNNPGSWAHVPAPLRHAAWHGCSPADLVFPFFLFIVGAAMALSFARRREDGATTADLRRKVVSRALLIFALGLLLNGFPFGLPLGRTQAQAFVPGDVLASLESLRLLGVLQRIALCYLLAGLIAVALPAARARIAAALGLAVIYELLMRLPLVAGWGGGSFALADNFVRWCDLRVVGEAHLYRTGGLAFDPEGLVSTLGATATTLGGLVAGEFLRRRREPVAALRPLATAGVAAFLAGVAAASLEPVNKQLWTLSYVLVTGGLAAAGLAGCLWLVDIRGWRRWVQPAVVFGANPLVAFVGSGLLARLLALSRLPDGAGGEISPKQIVYARWLAPWAGTDGASVLFALASVGFWLAVLWWMHRRRWYLRI